ncbi:MAG: helix-turn-helix transcriptional regulator [Austwickia sp.]|nr:helix-turn-helix transcriptional regulator [Austwickia sp.]
MATRDYGQYCGLARALDLVGERWGLLIVRDLLCGPLRFGELQSGLVGIPSNVLTNRLKELEAGGVIERVLLAAPARGTAYALTEAGRSLEATLVALGRWGAARLGDLRQGEVVTAGSFAMALRTTFRPGAAWARARGLRGADGRCRGGAIVQDHAVTVTVGALDDPDVVVETGPAIKAVMAGDLTPDEAVAGGAVTITGSKRAWRRFPDLFRI